MLALIQLKFLAQKSASIKINRLRLLLPVIIVPNWVLENSFQQRCSSKCAGKWHVSLWSLLDIISEFRSTEPFLLTLDFSILGRPANLTAENLKVTLGLSPLSLQVGFVEMRGEVVRKMQILEASHMQISQYLRTFCTEYPNFPLENLFHRRSMVARSVEGMFLTSVKYTNSRPFSFDPAIVIKASRVN